ncbi:hypothetical protein, partial [Aestuariivirga sp.]|uniref:hypothetical protein n=1 Tax=Aestuariivirga sp. TaxID=2650926 RepID=UPI0039192D73
MNRVVKLGAVSCLAVLVGGVGIASAEAPAKKRKPTLFEQIFGSPSKSRAERSRKNRSRIFVNRDQHNANAANGIQVINGQDRDARRKTPNVVVADSDPEGDPGLGRGNLRYAAPKLVGLSGLKLADPRPAEASAQAIHDQLSGEGPSLRVLPEAREALLDQYRSQNFRPIWLENGKLSV